MNAIPYTLSKWKSRLCSRCELFTSKAVSFVPVGQIVTSGGMQAVIDYYGTLDTACKAMLEDMLVFDAVIGNTDRHFGNFGFLVDAATNTLKGTAPLFDQCETFQTETALNGLVVFLFAAQAPAVPRAGPLPAGLFPGSSIPAYDLQKNRQRPVPKDKALSAVVCGMIFCLFTMVI